MRRLIITLAMAMLLAGNAAAQVSGWTSYLDDPLGDEAQLAVVTVEEGIDSWRAARDVVFSGLIDLHVAARDRGWSPEAYRDRLEAAASSEAVESEREALASIRSALSVIAEMLAGQSPAAASPFARNAEQWLLSVSGALGHTTDTERVALLLQEIRLAGQNASTSDARAALAALALPTPVGFESASAGDQLQQVLANWWLIFLASPDGAARSRALGTLADATQSLSADSAALARGLSRSFTATAENERRLSAVVRNTLPVLGARTIGRLLAELEHGDVTINVADSVGSLLAELDAWTRADLAAAADRDATVRFAVEVLGWMAPAFTDRQMDLLAATAGRSGQWFRLLTGMLYRVRLDLAGPAIDHARETVRSTGPAYEQTPEYQEQAALLYSYKRDGERYLEELSAYLDGERSRSDNAFRWAMLSALSNRYTQELLLSDPARSAEQRLLAGFAVDLYGRVVTSLDSEVVAGLRREPLADHPYSYDRTYTMSSVDGQEMDPNQAAARVYRSFVTLAQGTEGGDEQTPPVASQMSELSDWVHQHGLHVAVETDQDAALAQRALVWFELANYAEYDFFGITHAIRGMGALRLALENALSGPLREAGNPPLELYDARLAEARDCLRLAADLQMPPAEAAGVLSALFGYAGTVTMERVLQAMDESLAAVSARLSRVEVADLETLRLEAGGSR